jgi:hypothetical protein
MAAAALEITPHPRQISTERFEECVANKILIVNRF